MCVDPFDSNCVLHNHDATLVGGNARGGRIFGSRTPRNIEFPEYLYCFGSRSDV